MCVEGSQVFAAHVRIECQHLRESQRPNVAIMGKQHERTKVTTSLGKQLAIQ